MFNNYQCYNHFEEKGRKVSIIPTNQMTEEDIKLNYIMPAIEKKWKDHITMETQITDGRISLKGNVAFRVRPKG